MAINYRIFANTTKVIKVYEGTPGKTGPQGPQGPTGAQGPAGSQGPAGLQGSIGPQGSMGPAGSQGPQGIQGPIGSQGVQGLQGPQGSSGVYYGTSEPTDGSNVWIDPSGTDAFEAIVQEVISRLGNASEGTY